MVTSVARRDLPLPAGVAFDRLTALRNHERLIPLTTMDVPDRRPRVGDVAVATSAGFFRDTMELVALERPGPRSPGRARWVKRGPVLLGEAEIVVTPRTDGTCLVEWFDHDIRLAGPLGGLSVRPLTALIAVMTGAALRRLDRLSAPRHDAVHRSS